MRLVTTLSDAERAAHIAARRKGSALWRLIHRGGSLHLAMVLLLTIALACAVATFAESRFDGDVARRYIYKAPWFLAWLGVLCLNLLCVTLTRWPWQRQHLGFVITHYGIITLLAGAIAGRTFGFEGFLDLEIGQPPTRLAVLQQQVIQVDLPGAGLRRELALGEQGRLPSPAKPWTLDVPGTGGAVLFGDYSPKMVMGETLEPAPAGKGAPGIALRFESGMMRQSLSRVVLQAPEARRVSDFFGLARIEWGADFAAPAASPLPTLRVHPEGNAVAYALYRDGKPLSQGVLEKDAPLALGWADWQVTLASLLPNAVAATEPLPAPNAAGAADAAPGLLVSTTAGGKAVDGPVWLLSGDRRTFRTAGGVPLRVAFGLKTRRLPFTVELLKFEVPRDEGTDDPADFIGTLRFDDGAGNVRVGQAHMNYPASYPGGLWRSMLGWNYKFSQTSWNPQNLNETTLQLLYDPGWPLKWVGSLLVVTGIVLLFYFRPRKAAAASPSRENLVESSHGP